MTELVGEADVAGVVYEEGIHEEGEAVEDEPAREERQHQVLDKILERGGKTKDPLAFPLAQRPRRNLIALCQIRVQINHARIRFLNVLGELVHSVSGGFVEVVHCSETDFEPEGIEDDVGELTVGLEEGFEGSARRERLVSSGR